MFLTKLRNHKSKSNHKTKKRAGNLLNISVVEYSLLRPVYISAAHPSILIASFVGRLSIATFSKYFAISILFFFFFF